MHTESPIELDALGLKCPAPLLMLKAAMRDHPDATTFDMVADDPLVHVDLAAFCARFGHQCERRNDKGAYRVTRKA